MAFHSTAPVPRSAVAEVDFYLDGTAGSSTAGTNTLSRCFNVIELPDFEATHEEVEIYCGTTLEGVEPGKRIRQRIVLEHNFRAHLDSSAADSGVSGTIGTGDVTLLAALRADPPYGDVTYRYAAGELPNINDRVGVDGKFAITKSDGSPDQVVFLTQLALVSHTVNMTGGNHVTERIELEWHGSHTFTG